MTVEELIEELSQYPQNMQVVVATQRSYPLACSIDNILDDALRTGERALIIATGEMFDYGDRKWWR